jgi:hypothetical protein
MMTIGKRIAIFCLILGTGCAPMKEIDIQIIYPAEVTLPLSVHELAFLNRSVIPRLLHPDSSRWTDEEYYILDTIMNNWIFNGVRQSMMESPLYDLDAINIIRSRRSDTIGLLKPMTAGRMNQLKRVHPADAVISLEYYDLIDSSKAYMIVAKDEDGLPAFEVEAYLGLYSSAAWRIYDLILDTVIDFHAIRDTMTWYNDGETFELAVEGLPPAIDAVRAAAFNIGTIYGKRISPVWLETPRYFHALGGKEMKQAAKLAGQGNWQDAAAIWKNIASGEKRRAAAHACFNMALFFETEDEIIPALDWAVKSYAIRQETLTREYIELLKQRYEDWKKLIKQIPAFTD